MQNKRTILFLTGKYSTDIAEAVLERVATSNDNLGIVVNQRELESSFKINFLNKIFPLNSRVRRNVRNVDLSIKDTLSNKKIVQAIGYKSHNVLHRHIYNVLNRYSPDLVCVTSAAVMIPTLSAIHKQGKNTKVVAICDNFVLDERMINRNVDYYYLDNFDMRNKLILGGISEEKIEITPLPLKKKALDLVTKEDAVKKMGLDEHKKNVLIYTGGDERFKGVINALSSSQISANVIFACDNNVQLLNMARNKGFMAHNEGINIHLAISAADLVITIPESTLIAESIYKKKLVFGLLPLTPKDVMVLDYLSTDTIVKIENEKSLVEKTATYISDLETGSWTGYEEIFKLMESKEFVDSSEVISKSLVDMIITQQALYNVES